MERLVDHKIRLQVASDQYRAELAAIAAAEESSSDPKVLAAMRVQHEKNIEARTLIVRDALDASDRSRQSDSGSRSSALDGLKTTIGGTVVGIALVAQGTGEAVRRGKKFLDGIAPPSQIAQRSIDASRQLAGSALWSTGVAAQRVLGRVEQRLNTSANPTSEPLKSASEQAPKMPKQLTPGQAVRLR